MTNADHAMMGQLRIRCEKPAHRIAELGLQHSTDRRARRRDDLAREPTVDLAERDSEIADLHTSSSPIKHLDDLLSGQVPLMDEGLNQGSGCAR